MWCLLELVPPFELHCHSKWCQVIHGFCCCCLHCHQKHYQVLFLSLTCRSGIPSPRPPSAQGHDESWRDGCFWQDFLHYACSFLFILGIIHNWLCQGCGLLLLLEGLQLRLAVSEPALFSFMLIQSAVLEWMSWEGNRLYAGIQCACLQT